MKKQINILIALNIVIAAALIVLYILHFSADASQKTTSEKTAKPAKTSKTQIAYVNTDSVLKKYEFVSVMEAKLKGKGEAMKKELERRQRKLRQKIKRYREQVKNNTIGVEQAKVRERALKREQEELYSLQKKYSTKFADQQMGMNKELLDTVRTFLNRYNKDKNFDLILARSATNNNILFARDTFNITSDIITKMNKEYKNQEKTEKE